MHFSLPTKLSFLPTKCNLYPDPPNLCPQILSAPPPPPKKKSLTSGCVELLLAPAPPSWSSRPLLPVSPPFCTCTPDPPPLPCPPLPSAPPTAPAAGGAAAAGEAKSSSDSMISTANCSCYIMIHALRKYSKRVKNIHRLTFSNLYSFPNTSRSRALASATSPTSQPLALGRPPRRRPWMVAASMLQAHGLRDYRPYWPVFNAHMMPS